MKKLLGTLALAVVVLSAAGPAWAKCCQHGDQCPMAKMRHSGWDEEDASPCPITAKALHKATFYLKHAEEIGLSEEQIQAIAAIKLDLKKTAARQQAEMQVFELDVQAKMSEPTVDAEALNALVDGAAQGMVASTKGVIAQYAKLRGLLSAEQQKKAKEIWKKQP